MKQKILKTMVVLVAASFGAHSMAQSVLTPEAQKACLDSCATDASAPKKAIKKKRNAPARKAPMHNLATGNIPPNARPGECFANVLTYTTKEESYKVVTPATVEYDVIPAQTVEKQKTIVVKPASYKYETIEAEFEEVTESILKTPESTEYKFYPATFKKVSKQRLITPASTMWKRSSQLTAEERQKLGIQEGQGDVMCLIEIPAIYDTYEVEEIDQEARTEKDVTPAEYTTITKQVLKRPARVEKVLIPAETETVTYTVMVKPEKKIAKKIPAVVDTQIRTVQVPHTEWRQVLCDINATPTVISEVQNALTTKGFDSGSNNGILDTSTLTAVQKFQNANGLPVDQGKYINLETIRKLGINY